MLELNQDALREAVAKRKSRIENADASVVTDIESRLQKSKKLQAAKFFNPETKRYTSEKPDTKPAEIVLKKTETDSSKPKEIASKFDTPKPKLSAATPVKSITNADPSGSNVTTLDLKSRLKPVEAKSEVSSIASSSTTTIVAAKFSANKSKAPAPPPPAVKRSPSPNPKSNPKPSPIPDLLPAKISPQLKSEQPATPKTSDSVNSPVNSSTPVTPNTPTSPERKNSDYIALAERARQEYLKKKASGSIEANVKKVEKKGPVEITPTRKNSPRSPSSTQPQSPRYIEVKPALNSGEAVNVSIKDRIKNLQPVKGVTEDHSHTEQSLSNGTMKKVNGKTNGSVSPPPSLVSANGGSSIDSLPPPPGFEDRTPSPIGQGVHIDIIPPPSSFTAGSPASPAGGAPAFGQDDSASLVSSVSSLSTLSSEHGEGALDNHRNIQDLIAPPPPSFGDANDPEAFVPPPPQFLELDANANLSKSSFTSRPVATWSCGDVCSWLDSLGLTQYRDTFANGKVTGKQLVNMGRNEFIALGVTQVGHRMNLERSVKKLTLASSTNL